jgi:nitroreductase
MDTLECIASRRSVRSFTEEKPSRELIEKIIASAAWAVLEKHADYRYIAIEDRQSLMRSRSASPPPTMPASLKIRRCCLR